MADIKTINYITLWYTGDSIDFLTCGGDVQWWPDNKGHRALPSTLVSLNKKNN